MSDNGDQLAEPSTSAIVKRNWFQIGTLSALSLIAFSVFYHFVIAETQVQRAVPVKEARVNTPVENENIEVSETSKKEPTLTEQREKAARDLEQAQAEFEREVRNDHARAKALQDQEDERLEARRKELASRLALSQCFVKVQARYTNHWNHTCAIQGRPERCTLRPEVATILEQNRRAARDECYKLNPLHTNFGR